MATDKLCFFFLLKFIHKLFATFRANIIYGSTDFLVALKVFHSYFPCRAASQIFFIGFLLSVYLTSIIFHWSLFFCGICLFFFWEGGGKYGLNRMLNSSLWIPWFWMFMENHFYNIRLSYFMLYDVVVLNIF